MKENLKFFKINYAGSVEEILPEELLANFNFYSAIVIYVPVERKMHVWIGEKAPKNLKKSSISIREIFNKEYPEISILRNMTIESGSEPNSFFELCGFTSAQLKSHLRSQEIKLLPIISEINHLKEKADKHFINDEFEEVIELAIKIKLLAKQINDESLENAQEHLIEEVKILQKGRNLIKQLIEKSAFIKIRIDQLVRDKNYLGAHYMIQDFVNEYEKDYHISIIPEIEDLISYDRGLSDKINVQRTKLIEALDNLEKRFLEYLKENHFSNAQNSLLEAKAILKGYHNKDVSLKWNKYEEQISQTKSDFKNDIKQLSMIFIAQLEQKNLKECAELVDKIIEKLEMVN
ncbi:MAG: hypothetical protein MUP85_00680 [Candidatus Lokiarchaeota archaeon]|nr:hypothetical protein [Candidatus Lokiarchaeota archaeon]